MTSVQSDAFQRVRPHCIELSREAFLPKTTFDPSSATLLKALRSVEHELEKLEEIEKLAPAFADYVFIPIAHLLQQGGLGTSQTEAVLLIIGHLLSLSWSSVGSFPQALAQQLFPLLTYLISSDRDNKDLLKKPVQFQYSGCVVLKKFFKALAIQKLYHVYTYFSDPKSLPSLGHSVTILLDILQGNDHESDLQLMAIEALHTLYVKLLQDGETISFILPGNVSTFSKLLLKPGLTVNADVVCSTMGLFGSLLSLVYCDHDLHISKLPAPDLQHRLTERQDSQVVAAVQIDESAFKNKHPHRTNKWLKATTSQVKTALEAILPKLLKRENSRINNAIKDFLETVVDKCHDSLSNCLELFTVTSLDTQLPAPRLLESCGSSGMIKLTLENQISNFPTALQFESVKVLQRFSFALSVLAQNSERDFELIDRAVFELQRSFSDFLEQKNLRFNDYKVIEQSSLVIIGQDLFEHTDQLHQVFPRVSKSFEEALSNLLHNVGTYCGIAHTDDMVMTLLTKNYTDSTHGKAVAIWISSLLIKGSMKKTEKNDDIVDQFLAFDVNQSEVPAACFMVLESCLGILNEVSQNGRTITRSEEIDAIVGLHSIKLMNESMESEFEGELIDVLFPVMDCLASSSPSIRSFAQVTTMEIARSHYGGSVRDLIWENMDYLVDSLSIRLSNCMTQRVATLLMVICRIGGYDTIRSFKDVLETIFRLLDYYHGYEDLCVEFFQLFDIVVTEMNKKYLGNRDSVLKLTDKQELKGSFGPWEMQNIHQVTDVLERMKSYRIAGNPDAREADDPEPGNFQEFFNSKLREVDSDDEEEDNDIEKDLHGAHSDGNPEDASKKWTSPIPRDSYRLLLQITAYGDRLLTHSSRPLKVQILQLARKIFPMLATEYDMLLPQVAKSWDMVVQISLGADYSLVKPALECLRSIINCSGDFVTKRFIDMWGLITRDSALLQNVGRRRANLQVSGKGKTLVKAQNFPSITTEALKALGWMILEGISKTELLVTDAQLQEMVRFCLLALPADTIASRSLILGDMVSSLQI
ncbi:LAME_0G15104g1_1 [Lachancea meyersii CBS 8951]|uniref:LAME_0G15104g1_1 n=1 Tax=Lachancea meyersii CBS 8951 TaxID=1266667 RepID=A0A1G4KAM4_9SACH|nr:LAME_0G15104g1_1 [Lachancea meyersii CBS 8951]